VIDDAKDACQIVMDLQCKKIQTAQGISRLKAHTLYIHILKYND
jgi:hypothetical protein